MRQNANQKKEKSIESQFSYEELMIKYQKALQEIQHLKFLEQESNQKIAKFYSENLEEIKLLKVLLQEDKNKVADFAKKMTRLYEEAVQAIQHLKGLLHEDKNKLTNLEEEVARLKEQINLMQHQIFGKKSEVHVGEPINSEDPELQVVSAYTRQKGKKSRGRTIDTSTLLRHRIYHDLPESEQTCKVCNNHLIKIGEYISEQLEIIPAKIYVVEHVRYKYSCPCCKILIMAPKPQAPIPKSLAGGSLITEIIVNKYQYHLPLYRQSKMLASYNVLIPDNTLGNLVMLSGEGLMPIYEACWKTITSSDYLQADETPVKILKPNKKGYLWTYYAPLVGKGLVVYELALSRESEVAQQRLANFKGLLQTDGYSGYNGLRDREDITGFSCMSHGRRKFDAVLKITKNKDGIAAEAINRLKPIYALEKKMRDAGVSFHTRKRLRQKYAKPLLDELHIWLKQIKPKVLPKSKLMVAISYMLNQWPYLNAYLRHGKVEIDNNWIENKNRPVALGRRNWLFMGNKNSGTINAMWYTLVQSALLNNLNPRVYIHYLLTQIHAIRKNSVDIATLLPHTIDHAILQNFAKEQMVLTQELFNSLSASSQEADFAFINVFNDIDTSNSQLVKMETLKKPTSFKDFSKKASILDSS